MKSNVLKSVLYILSDFATLFFPNICLGCEGFLVKGEETICTNCLRALPKTNYHLLDENPIKTRLIGRLPLKYALAFLKFRKTGVVQQLMHQLKYNNHPEIGIGLGKLYGMDLLKNGFHKEFDLIIPVPLHQSRRRKRGYNQSSKFAEGVSEALGVDWSESISIRKTNTSTQTRKSREARWQNVKEVFDLGKNANVSGKRILLVDDVITTGATLEACGQQLLNAGCSELSIACIAEA